MSAAGGTLGLLVEDLERFLARNIERPDFPARIALSACQFALLELAGELVYLNRDDTNDKRPSFASPHFRGYRVVVQGKRP